MPTFPTYRQQDQMDCGPTCLRMIAKHYGKSIAIDALRQHSGIGKEGVNLLGIADAAEAIGFRTQGVQLSLAQLQTDAKLPCVLHWSQQHFVVLYKIRRGIYYLADPAVGLVNLSENEFGKRWLSAASQKAFPSPSASPNPSEGWALDPNTFGTHSNRHGSQNPSLEGREAFEGREALGIALLLEPTPAFYNSEFDDAFTETGTKGFGSVVKYLYPYKKLLLQLMLGVMLGSLLQLVLPFLTKSIVDTGISTNNLPFLYIILFAQLALFTGRLMVDFIRSWLLYHISSRINISILTDFLIKLMKLPLNYFDSKKTGDILQRMNDHSRIQSFLTGTSLSTLFSLFNLVVFSVVLARYNLTIFGVFVLASILYTLWIIIFLKRRKQLDYRQFDITSAEQSKTIQLIQGMTEIKLHGCETPKRWECERLQAKTFKLGIKNLALSKWQQTGAFFIN